VAGVAISIVNWNTRDHLVRCLEALETACMGISADVIVVDNASTDGSVEAVRTRFPAVRLFALQENIGFAAANNLAIENSTAEAVLLLNPDIYLSREALEGMLDFLSSRPDAGGVGAVLTGHDGEIQASFFRRVPSRVQVLLFYTTLELVTKKIPLLRRRYLEPDLRGRDPVAVDQLPGACCLVRRTAIEEVGMLDPDYFIWFEDVDWCYRMRRAGHALYALPMLKALHAGGASFENWSVDRKLWQFFRSYFRFLCKFRLDPLLTWSYRVVLLDLAFKELLVRIRPFVLPWVTRPIYSVTILRALATELRRVIRSYRRGELVRFVDDRVPGAADPAHPGMVSTRS
jgi:N-acetylglucosaminyl-diphospho-decaprenol L-rhamnosyltransferase